MIAAERELADEPSTSASEEFSSAAGRRAAERTARRRQGAEVSGAQARRGHRSTQSTRASTPAWTTMRDSVPSPLIAVIAGGVLGVILGALSVTAWVIGLLAAGLTVVLLRALDSPGNSTRAGAK
jgi:hypothetical protein